MSVNKSNELIQKASHDLNSIQLKFWYKVVDLIQKVIPQNKIHKIKNASDQAKINEYKALVNFILDKISYSQKSKVRYLKYWEPERTRTNSNTSYTESVSSSYSSNKKDLSYLPWVLGIVTGIIGGAIGKFGGFVIGAIIGAIIGNLIKNNQEKKWKQKF